MDIIAGFSYCEAEFTKAGQLHTPATAKAVADQLAAERPTDLVVISHGWNNDMAEARRLYLDYLRHLRNLIDHDPSVLADRRLAVLGLLWPSKKFAEEELIPGGGASLEAPDDRLRSNFDNLRQLLADPQASAVLDEAESLVPNLRDSQEARRQFVQLVRSLWPSDSPEAAHDGASHLATMPADELLDRIPVVRLGPLAGEGGAAGLGGLFNRAQEAARQLLNFTTYYVMKERAGTVGTRGVAPLLTEVHRRLPALRIHLVGHSFGGRLVTAVAAALVPQTETPLRTLLLLQAAFSHHGFARNFDGGRDGFFRQVVEGEHVDGPILITHTRNDKAVGLAYALASRVARDDAAALGDAHDRFGGIGSNGAQKTTEAQALLLADRPYQFAPGAIYNLLADDVISGHSEVANRPTARVLLEAIKSAR